MWKFIVILTSLIGLVYLSYVYIDTVLLPFTYKFAINYYPKIAYSTFKSTVFKILQKSGFVFLLKKSWRRQISVVFRWCKIKTKRYKNKMIFRFKKAPVYQKILFFMVPVGIMLFISFFFSFLWFFIIPIFGVPTTFKMYIKSYAIRFAGKLGLTQLSTIVYGKIPRVVREHPERIYSTLKVKLFRMLIKQRRKFYGHHKIKNASKKIRDKLDDKFRKTKPKPN